MSSLNLSLIHPDDTIEQPITPISNMSPDCLFEFRSNDYISSAGDETHHLYLEQEILHDLDYKPVEFLNPDLKDKIGDGEMQYIKDKSDREMFTNAWKAITITDNWNFIAHEMDCFAFSKDPRIYEITEKMEELGYKVHSGTSFSLTMRSMQFLVQYGEEEFKNYNKIMSI
jgi:hypothetical protein